MPNGSVARRKEGITTMANNKTDCVRKATIDQEAKNAIDTIDPVLAAANPSAADLKKALNLAKDTLNVIRNDPHHL
jgi:hypothetical protein